MLSVEEIHQRLAVPQRPIQKIFNWLKFVGVSIFAGLVLPIVLVPINLTVSVLDSNYDELLKTLPIGLTSESIMEKTNVYAKNNKGEDVLLASYYDQNRVVVSWKDIPLIVKQTVVAAEDRQFYTHGAVDISALGRAFLSNLRGGEVQGGSSITQQLVKNLLIQQAESLTDEKLKQEAYEAATDLSPWRKLREVQLAFALERKYSKDEILLNYLNIVNFGGQVYGIQAAAQYYYGVDAKDLNLTQSATLIAIINNPNAFRIDMPDANGNNAANNYVLTKQRRDYIFDSLLETKKITQLEHDEAVASLIEPNITEPVTGCSSAGNAAYFCDYVTRVVLNNPVFGETSEARAATLKRGGLQIYTTLNLDLQNAASESILNHVESSSDKLDVGAASTTIEPGTGRILAMAQNKTFSNDATLAEKDNKYTAVNYNTDYTYGGSNGFQPGSTFKIFTLMEWFKRGNKIYDTINGQAIYTKMPNSCNSAGYWTGDVEVSNGEGQLPTRTSIMTATVSSLNTAFLAMAQQMDLCNIIGNAESLGVQRADGKPMIVDATSVLGTNEVSPLSMANAYATIAADGVYCQPIAIDHITDAQGVRLEVPEAACSQVIEKDVARTLGFILQKTVAWGSAGKSRLNDNIPMLGKTGTSDKAVHTWMVGSTTEAATAVWVGNVKGYTSLWSYSYAGVGGDNIRHAVFKEIHSVANQLFGGKAFIEPTGKLVN